MKKRLLSILLTLCIACSVMPAMVLTASAYTARTTAPDTGNSYYYSSANPFYPNYVGQCTWYAFGRAYEILGSRPQLSTGNANQWYSYNQSHGYYAYGTEPRVGAIACWYLNGASHVAVVEAINGGTVYISEFNRNSDKSFHYTEAVSNGRGPDGYIYLTEAGASNTVTVTTGEAEKISDTEYTLHGAVQSTSATVTEVGIYIGSASDNLTKLGSDSVGSLNPTMWYNTAKYGYTLNSGTIYFYRAYAVAGGQTYWGDVKSFITDVVISLNDGVELRYDANGGTNAPSGSSYWTSGAEKAHTFTISASVPTRSGYTFLGWSLSADAQAPSYYSGGEITISSDTTLYAVWEKAVQVQEIAQTSIVKISFAGETISVTTDMQWTNDPYAVNPIIFTAFWDDDLLIAEKESASYGLYFGNTLYFRENETGAWQKLVIPERPAAPTGVSADEGKITGVSTAMEYRPSDSAEWIRCDGSTVQNLNPGKYYVRFKATNTNFASNYTTVEISARSNGVDTSNDVEDLSPTYTVTVGNIKNGTVTVSPKNASKGTTVTLTVKPNSGCELDYLDVTDKNGNTVKLTHKSDTKYTFTMPASEVKVEASFTKIEEQPKVSFTDVSTDTYYYDAVAWAVENGITSGTSATTFSPNATCTRAQAMTFLWRAAGSPAPKSSVNPFTDVPSSAYYYDAVLWAVEQGITAGTSAATFSPDASCTRGQIVTFLHRADGTAATGRNPFTDVANSAYYADAVKWALAEGVTAGTSATTFSPDASCSRAQIVTFLYRVNAD